ncbi:MAG: C10 family peptidase [Bacteroidales bacterium]|nr:C10 family peptidase [Bacteroidales bacterium]
MKLKYLLVALCAFSYSWSSQAAPVSKAKAMQLASRYVRLSSNKKLHPAQFKAAPGATPAYYIFNDKEQKGFVIVSGDDRTAPILGYASAGHLNLNQLPEQLLTLLATHTDQLEKTKAMPFAPGLPTPTPKPNPKAVKGPLLRSYWNQNAPYNNLTPLIGKERTVTGCVGTAMAQLMYYHKWPLRGKGSHSYSANVGHLSVNFAESVYDWANMLPRYVYSESDGLDPRPRRPLWNDVEAQAVAKLMLDAGVAIGTRYALSDVGSGSNVGAAAKALTDNFGYHTQTLYRNNTPTHEFLTAIKQELDASNPILMVGSHETSGHAWVIDGYDENGYLHVNWGWGGMSNGYFALSFMSPDDAGIGGFVGGYNQGQVIVLAHPNKEGTEGFGNETSVCAYLQPNAGLRFETATTDVEQRKLSIKVTRLGKRKDPSYKAKVALALRNERGEQLHIFEHTDNLEGKELNAVYNDFTMSLSLPVLADGEYTLHTLCKSAQQPEDKWRVAGKDLPLRFSVHAGKVLLPAEAHQKGVALSLLAPPQQLTPLWKGEATSLQLSIANPTPYDTEFGNIVLRLKRNGESKEVVVTQFRFHDHSRYDGIVSLSSALPNPLEVGVYDVEFLFRRTGVEHVIANPFAPCQVEVLESAGKPILTLAQDYQSRNGTSRSVSFKQGEYDWMGERVALKKLNPQGLTLHSILYNKSDVLFNGKLAFALVHPQTGARYALETKENAEVRPQALSDLVVELSRQLLEQLPKNERLELRIFATIDGVEREVWGNGVYRRALVLSDADDSPVTHISTLHQEVVSLHVGAQQLVLRGVRKGERVQIVALTGKVLYQTAVATPSEWSLPIAGLPAGSYVLRVGTYACKFFVP